MIRVLIAHQDNTIRLALRMFLQAQQEIEVVAEVRHVGELLRDAAIEHPGLIIMSWNLLDFDKYSVTGHRDKIDRASNYNQIKCTVINSLHNMPSKPYIVVTSSKQDDVFAVLYAGADDFLYHGEDPIRLLALLDLIREKT